MTITRLDSWRHALAVMAASGCRTVRLTKWGSAVDRSRAVGCVLAVLSVSLEGCGDGGHQWSNLQDLHKAAVEAGLDCPSWDQQVPHTGFESGSCSENSVLVLYTDGQNPEKEIGRTISRLGDLDVSFPFLVGENWMVNSPDAGELQDAMGGKVLNMF